MSESLLHVGEILRYTKPRSPDRLTHGHRSYWALERGSEGSRLLMEAGVNAPREVVGPEGRRLPVVALRSTPRKAGTIETPWHDDFRLEDAAVRYFSDHRADKEAQLGETPGDRRLEGAWAYHRSASVAKRMEAPPIVIFRTVPVMTQEGPQTKGFVEFCGLGVMTDLVATIQRDPRTEEHFENYFTDLALLSLGKPDALDWNWIIARRNAGLAPEELLELAPAAWREWVELGPTALPQLRRMAAPQIVEPAPRLSGMAPIAPSGLAWLAARAIEHFLGADRTRLMPIMIDNPRVPLLRGVYRFGAGPGAADFRVLGVAAERANDAMEAGISLRSQLGPGQIGVVVTPALLSESQSGALRGSGTPLLVLSGDDYRKQLIRIAEQSFDGDMAKLESYARGSSKEGIERQVG